MKKKKTKNLFLTIPCGIALILALVLIARTPAAQKLNLDYADRLYQTGYSSSLDIVIIRMDDDTIAELGKLGTWNRSKYLTAIDNLEAAGASVIGLDVILEGNYDGDPENEEDLRLASALETYGNIIVASELRTQPDADGTGTSKGPEGLYSALQQRIDQGLVTTGFSNVVAEKFFNENSSFDSAFKRFSFKELSPKGFSSRISAQRASSEAEDIIRHAALSFQIGEETYYSLAWQIAQTYAALGDGNHDLLEDRASHKTEGSGPEVIYLTYSGSCDVYHEDPVNFTTLSYLDVYHNSFPPAMVRDKVVLIGAWSSALGDDHRTAINHQGGMPGVAIVGDTIRALLDDHYPVSKEADAGHLLAAAAGLLFLLLLVCVFAPLPAAVLLTAGGGILWLWSGRLLAARGLLAASLWGPVGCAMLLVYTILLHLIEERGRRNQIRAQFGRYVDQTVLRRIEDLEDLDHMLTGEKKEIAVLFIDLCGFTTLSEQLSSEQIVSILNEYFEMITACASRWQGTIDKYIGDCAMIIWNAPETDPDYLFHAASCALDMIIGMEELSTRLGLPLHASAGIAAGEAIIGNIGSSRRMDFTAVGDIVNTASRLQGMKIAGRKREDAIYLSEPAAHALAGRLPTICLGEHAVKGKELPVRVYQLVSHTSEKHE